MLMRDSGFQPVCEIVQQRPGVETDGVDQAKQEKLVMAKVFSALEAHLMISFVERPLGSKSLPPLPPPMGSVVRAFLKICSKPKNLMMLRFTEGWNRRPPL